MNRTPFSLLPAVALLLAACNAPARPMPASGAYAFDDLTATTLPPDWRALETNGRGHPGTWRIQSEAAGRVLQLTNTANVEDTFNLVLLPGDYPADLSLQVRVRADAGREDRGGGLVWRARGAEDYYVARWNPLEANVRAYHVVGSRRTMIANADVSVDPAAWHTLGVVARGDETVVSLDGSEVLRYRDRTLSGGGAVGVWTKADAATSFDDVQIRPANGQ